MSSRLTHQVMENPQAYNSLKQRLAKKASCEELLQLTEWAMVQQEAAVAQRSLKALNQRFPHEPDTLYLQLVFQLHKEATPQELIAYYQAQTLAHPIKKKTRDSARLLRWIAEQHYKIQDYAKAQSLLQEAFLHADAKPLNFVHVLKPSAKQPAHANAVLSARELAFDLSIFDLLYPWSERPCFMQFSAVHVSQDRVYIIESYHSLLFCFNTSGELIYGLREHDLADSNFVHPEHILNLKDISASEQSLYVAGSQQNIHVYNHEGVMERSVQHAETFAKVPLSLANTASGDLFAIYKDSSQVHHFDPRGAYQGTVGSNTTLTQQNKSYFCGLAAKGEHVYLYDGQRVQQFKLGETAPLKTWSLPELELPENLCWNGISVQEQVFVVHTQSARLYTLNPTREQASFEPVKFEASTTKLSQPNDVAADTHGGVYIADTGNARVVYANKQRQLRPFLTHSAFVCPH